jgi:hypothetical protein
VPDCLLCGYDRRDCSCFAGEPEVDERRPDRELVTLAVLDVSGVLDGVPGIPAFF